MAYAIYANMTDDITYHIGTNHAASLFKLLHIW